MKKKTLMITVLFQFILFSYIKVAFAEGENDTISVSIIRLIANPEKYDGKNICVSGYFLNEFENRKLYMDELSAKNWINENGISLILRDTLNGTAIAKYHHKYVTIKGKFRMAPSNNKNIFGNNLSDVYSIEVITPYRW